MAKPKKDWTALNIRMNSGIYNALAQYADDKSQNKTIAVERILKEKLASLRDFLLPMLMNGQVTFKN